MRNYIDELTAATSIVKGACDAYFNYDSSSPTMIRLKDYDLQENIISQLKATFYGDVVVRVSDSYALAMHIDTDEANAAFASGTVYGRIVK